MWAHVQSLGCVWLFMTPWTVAHQTPLSMGFSRQEYRSGLPFSTSRDLPDPALSPHLCIFTLAGGFFTIESPGKPRSCGIGSKTVRGHQNYLEGLLKHSCLAGFQPQHFWFSRSWIRWNIFFSNGFPGPVDAAGPGTTFSDAVYWSDVCK